MILIAQRAQRVIDKIRNAAKSGNYDCNKCGYRYYHSTILQRVEVIANGKRFPERTEIIPVAQLG